MGWPRSNDIHESRSAVQIFSVYWRKKADGRLRARMAVGSIWRGGLKELGDTGPTGAATVVPGMESLVSEARRK